MNYPQLLTALREVGTAKVYRAGSYLAFQNEVPRYGSYIIGGVVKAYSLSPEGDEKLVNMYAKHSIVPIEWLNGASSSALLYYQAMDDVRAISFTRADLQKVLTEQPQANAEYLRFVSSAHTSLLFRVMGLCQTSAAHKVCYALYLLAFRYGVERADGIMEIPIPLTHETIGNFIGQSRENTAKTIKKLSDDGIIGYQSKTYSVNMKRVEGFIGEDSFRSVTL